MGVFVEGLPISQGSMKSFRNHSTGKIVMIHNKAEALAAWRSSVAYELRSAAQLSFERHDPVAVYLDFYLPRPKSVKRALPTVYPDIDKLTRAVLDALTQSRIIVDDAQITHSEQWKRYADHCPAGVEIEITKATNKETK